jgi:hypothetical protein
VRNDIWPTIVCKLLLTSSTNKGLLNKKKYSPWYFVFLHYSGAKSDYDTTLCDKVCQW